VRERDLYSRDSLDKIEMESEGGVKGGDVGVFDKLDRILWCVEILSINLAFAGFDFFASSVDVAGATRGVSGFCIFSRFSWLS